ncbi:I78 family peptidase inhibitor [Shimia biformata]|uniref:I78 family peptidase inhibitor n=1 Tax=Shimia biformata TaxID=1294299 RepID=UPI001EF2772E|nr:I78 family peptidase inhibitor [Shimia biformata]
MRLALTAAMTVLALGGCVDPDTAEFSDTALDPAPGLAVTEETSSDMAEDMAADVPLTGSKSCKDEVFAALAGKPLSIIDTIETPDNMRILPPGSISTSDYIPQRLNVEHDDQDVITSAYCG